MFLERLSLRLFRGFNDFELVLKAGPGATILLGSNGSGKSSILDAIAVLASDVVEQITGAPGGEYRREKLAILPSDIPNAGFSALIEGTMKFGGLTAKLARLRQRRGPYLSTDDTPPETTRQLEPVVATWWAEARNGIMPALPLTVQYGPDRGWLDIPARIRTVHDFTQLDAYEGALGGTDTRFRHFFEWFRDLEDIENANRLRTFPQQREPHLDAVRSAVASMMPGYADLEIQRVPLRMTLQKIAAKQDLSIEQLSHGEKALLGLVADLARRLCLAAPSLLDPLQAEALVLIDEIELHLHPGWQRVVVERLTKTFPNCQFILTTHSPQILSSVPSSSVVALKDFARYPLPAGTDGRDSNSLLTEVMGVPERPQWAADELHRVAKLMDDGRLSESRELLHSLAARMGEHDAEIVRLRTLVDFLEGKA